jgi:hypothetical protein
MPPKGTPASRLAFQHRLFAHRELQMKEAVIRAIYRLGERDLQALTSCWISRARNNLREMNVRPPPIAHLS